METGRVINRRYLLQRRIKQGRVCAIYQGMDQVLQRIVTVKVVPPAHLSEYRLAVRMTSAFSHPNIVGLYDLVVEQEALYIVQEYVEGEDFARLLQLQLSPFDVVDLGIQICQSLMYAGSPSRNVCHGDLVPAAVMRDRNGLVRVNNFALPSDLYYFENWCPMGGNAIATSDRELPWGQQSEGRRDDDTRAAGLLLYQLLAGRPAGATSVEPSADGRLRFMRNIPADLCETVARAVVRLHPQHISTPEALYENLRIQAEVLEPPLPAPAAVGATYAQEEPLVVGQFLPANPVSPAGAASAANPARLAPALPVRDTEHPGQALSAYRPEQPISQAEPEIAPAAATVADMPMSAQRSAGRLDLEAARRAAYPERRTERKGLSLALLILLIGVLAFIIFFVLGYFGGQLFFH